MNILNGPKIHRAKLEEFFKRHSPREYQIHGAKVINAYEVFGDVTSIGNLWPFAQAWLETGGFKSPRWIESFNPAGLGATDDGAWGASFNTIAEGVMAQYAHLLCYAGKEYTIPLEYFALMSPRRFALKNAYGLGCAPTWQELSGRWATDPMYYVKISKLVQLISR